MAKKKKTAKEIKAEIKKMEDEKRKEAHKHLPKETKVSFDSWYHQRVHKIPKMHTKEVIVADFRARGLGMIHTMEEFDKALKLYGIEL
jgi:hypothetical protein